jgi:hypothetical protein
MGWESTRPVPWRRLIREWAIYAGLMAVIFVVLFRDERLVGAFIGLVISGPLYLALGTVLAKVGYQRKTLKQMRAERVAHPQTPSSPATPTGLRQRPAPTRRTSGGGRSNRPGNRRR